MPYIAITCGTCGKKVTVNSEVSLGSSRFMELTCGHSQIEEILAIKAHHASQIKSCDGKTLRPYQVAGVEFIERSDARCLIADEMRLGKTPQALVFTALHHELWPVAVIVKSSLKEQWAREIMRWTDSDLIHVVESASDKIPARCEFYIFSFDILRRFKNSKTENDNMKGGDSYDSSLKTAHNETNSASEVNDSELVALFKRLKIKLVIIDECQAIKNVTSQRTVEIRNLIQRTNIKHVIALSGTPIKNSAAEYFSILNILRPEHFRVYQSYLNRWVDYYITDKGTTKYAGLRNPKAFQEFTKDFIIRRERDDVMPDLPKIDRNFKFTDLGEEVAEAYNKTLEEFQDYVNSHSGNGIEERGNKMAYMSKMRHLTGIAKVDAALDFCTDFVTSCNRKLVMFVHHKDVGRMLINGLKELCEAGNITAPVELSAEIPADKRQDVIDSFLNSDARFAVLSTLAYGEGVTMKECADSVIVERQWNPANEEQAECRFIHMEQKEEKVAATYLVAVGTIDELFSELVERKRSYFANTMGSKDIKWDETEIMTELTNVLMQSGKVRWKI